MYLLKTLFIKLYIQEIIQSNEEFRQVWSRNLESVGEEQMKAFGSLLLELQVAKDAISSLRSRYNYFESLLLELQKMPYPVLYPGITILDPYCWNFKWPQMPFQVLDPGITNVGSNLRSITLAEPIYIILRYRTDNLRPKFKYLIPF